MVKTISDYQQKWLQRPLFGFLIKEKTMSINNTIRDLREKNQWSQESMAELIGMSKNGYAKIERGETKVTFERLQQIAQAFEMDVLDLIKLGEKSFICLISENSDYSSNYYGNAQESSFELEKLHLIISHKEATITHKEEIIQQKNQEIETLKLLVDTLRNSK